MKRTLCLCIGVVALLAACASSEKRPTSREQVGTLAFLVQERLEGGEDVELERSGEVDRNSMIRIAFANGGELAGHAPADPRWLAVNDWLQALTKLVAARAELEARASGELDPAAVPAIIAEIDAFNDRVDALKASGEELMQQTPEGRAQLKAWEDALLDPTAPMPKSELVAKGEFFATEIERLGDALEDDLDRGDASFVLISAFAHRPGGAAVRLHVRNYDNIEGKDPAPVERLGLDLSTAERERLASELDQARRATEVLRELDGRVDRLVKEARALARRFREELRRIGEDLAAKSEWKDIVALLERADPTKLESEEQRTALARLVELAKAVQKTLESVQAIEELVRRGSALELDPVAALGQLLDAQGELRALVGDAIAGLTTLKTSLDGARKAAEESVRALQGLDLDAILDLALATAVSEPERARIDAWAKDVRGFLAELAPLLDAARVAAQFLGAEPTELAAAAAAVSAGDGVSVPRAIDDLEDGLVELGEAVEVGDRVRVVVQAFTAKDGKPGDPIGTPTELDFRVTRFGWRRTVYGEAILVRGISGGTGSKLEPNVAAMATWHHKQRDPSSFGRFLNWLDPGLGIHVASLDLDPDESVEFGLGVQLRLWDGLFFSGIGYDISVPDDRGYFYLGTSLLKLLGTLSE